MFKIVIEQSKLFDGLKKVRSTVGSGSKEKSIDNFLHMEIYQNSKNKSLLRLTTTNGTDITEISLPVLRYEDNDTTVLSEFFKLYKLIETIDGETQIEISDIGNNTLSINYKGRKKDIELIGTPNNGFMKTPKASGDIYEIKGETLKNGLNFASAVVVDNKEYPKFNCVNVIINPKSIEFQAVDATSKRMLFYDVNETFKSSVDFFVELSKTKKALSLFDFTKTIRFNVTSNNIMFKQGYYKTTLRLIDGAFPDIRSALKTKYNVLVCFNKLDMVNSLKRVSLFSDGNEASKSCILRIEEGGIEINLNSKLGIIGEDVLCKLKGVETEMSFKIQSLINSLQVIPTDDVFMCFYSKSNVILKPYKAKEYKLQCLVPAVRRAIEG